MCRPLRTRMLATFVLVLAGGGGLPAALEDPPPTPRRERPPNVLLVIADDFGVDAFDARAGSPMRARTPCLDRLRAEGVTFTRTWANPVCSPTRATILTGRYAFRTGVGNAVKLVRPGLPREELTIPEALDLAPELRYRHAAFGKWHLGNVQLGGADAPNLAGFSHFSGSLFGANPNRDDGTNGYFRWRHVENGVTTIRKGYRPTAMVDDALAWIRSDGRPWFAQVAFSLPHSPLHAPPAALHSAELPDDPPEEAPLPYFRAMVEAMDRELLRLLVGLGRSRPRTVVVFVGDNGTDGVVVEAAGEASEAQSKGMTFEGGIHVPLVVVGPDLAAGHTCDALVNTTDLFVTILDLAGVPRADVEAAARGPLDSESLVPLLRDPDRAGPRDLALAEVFADDPGLHTFRAVRDERYKLMRREGDEDVFREWLFDLERDPREEHDLLEGTVSDQARSIRDRLAARLDALREEK
ncbi:MAG: sulfatase-like hydrolase/transferase [Planctomycetota bacterium JB042]